MIKRFIFSATLLLMAHGLYGQGFLKADGKKIVNEKGEAVILRGMGLGGWMLQEGYMLRVEKTGQQQHAIRQRIEALVGSEKTKIFYDAWLANHTRKIDVDSMAAWGFNSIRLPFHFNLFTLPAEDEPVAGKDTWLSKGFEMTDSLLDWCQANKIYLILDMHGAPGGQGNDLNISDRDPSTLSLWDSDANQQKMIALWRKLAERYKNEPWIGAYDIINEPNWGFEKADDKNGCGEQKNEPLKKLMMEITSAIREVDQKHMIIIEGNCWGNNYNGILPPWDKNTVVSFHKYWSNNDAATIKGPLEIREQYNVPVWLGESGENSNLWFRDAINLVETNGIGWAWWPLKKIGFNNPLEIRMPSGYQKILDFWAEKGPKPTADEAYRSLMELANNLKLENCIYHKDVIDAMFRQTTSKATKQFKRHTTKSIVNAVDYDLGRNGLAYFDLDTGNYWVSGGPHGVGNHGRVYRNDGVDIGHSLDGPDAYYVDHIEPGEWLQYTIDSDHTGIYNAALLVYPEHGKGVINLSINNKPVADVSSSSTTEKWQTVEIKGLQFKRGLNVTRVKAVVGGYRFKSMKFTELKK